MKKILIFIICTIFSIGAFSKENKVVNGVETARIDGKTSWQRLALPVSGGKTTIRWSFYRDDYDESNADCQNKAWVDDIKFTAKEGK